MAEHAHRDRVLDLVYGEVEGAEARALRAELEACPTCGAELRDLEATKRLADQLPSPPLPTTTRSAILAAARAQAEQTRAQRVTTASATTASSTTASSTTASSTATPPAVGSPAVTPPPRPRAERAEDAESLWDRLRRFLLGPQMAMAAVMALVVTIGVWYLPGGRESPIGSTTMRPEPELAPDDGEGEVELAASEVAPPAEDPTTLRGDPQRAERNLAPREAELDARRPARRRSTTTAASAAPTPAPSAAENQAVRQELRADDALALAEAESSDEGYVVALGRGARAAEPDLPQEPAAAQPAPPADLDRESASLAPSSGEVAGGELAPRALHLTARNHASAGDCRTAARAYTDLFTRYPAYADLPRALLEAAECQRRLGNLSQARTLLVRAEGYPSTQAEAQRELRRLSTMQQAQRRARSMPSAPAALEDNAY